MQIPCGLTWYMMVCNKWNGVFCRLVRQYLAGEPYKAFLAGPYYWRYLQWKYLERCVRTCVCVYMCLCVCLSVCTCASCVYVWVCVRSSVNIYIYILPLLHYRAPIGKDHFRQYRVLGKGGFGLVSNTSI